MFKKITLSTIAALALSISGAYAAGGGEQHIEDYHFSFEGPFGTFDQAQLQRGLKVYTEVCAACHGLKYVPMCTHHHPTFPTCHLRRCRRIPVQ